MPRNRNWFRGCRVLEDYWFDSIVIDGKYRFITTIRPLDEWNGSVTSPDICPVCKANLATGTHDLDAHRNEMEKAASRDEYTKALDESVARHPAGSRLPSTNGPVRHRAEQ